MWAKAHVSASDAERRGGMGGKPSLLSTSLSLVGRCRCSCIKYGDVIREAVVVVVVVILRCSGAESRVWNGTDCDDGGGSTKRLPRKGKTMHRIVAVDKVTRISRVGIFFQFIVGFWFVVVVFCVCIREQPNEQTSKRQQTHAGGEQKRKLLSTGSILVEQDGESRETWSDLVACEARTFSPFGSNFNHNHPRIH